MHTLILYPVCFVFHSSQLFQSFAHLSFKRKEKKINHLYSDVYPNREVEVEDSILHLQ